MSEESKNLENLLENLIQTEESKKPKESEQKDNQEDEFFSAEKARMEEGRQIVHNLVIRRAFEPLFWTACTIVVLAVFARFWHLIAPACCSWLNEPQLDTLDKILLFILGVVVAPYFSSIFPGKYSGK